MSAKSGSDEGSGEGQREAAKLGEGYFLLFTSQARGGNAYCLMPNFRN